MTTSAILLLQAFSATAMAQQAPAQPNAPAPSTETPAAQSSGPRWGLDGGIIVFYPGPSYGVNISGRGGKQFNENLGVYLDLGAGAGANISASVSNSSVSASVKGAAYWRAGVLGEYDKNAFFAAAGPALFKGAWAGGGEDVGPSGTYQYAYAVAGYCPALLGRVGGEFGNKNRITLALEGMMVFGKMTEATQSVGATGVDQVAQVGDLAVGFSPALVLGWDFR
jgi:hypothetical protein